MKASAFLNLFGELIDLLAIRVPESTMVLADLLIPDEFSLRYRIGGRFFRPRLPMLPWFPRFLLLAALTRILLGRRNSEYFDSDPGCDVSPIARSLGRFLAALPEGRRHAILERVQTWPKPLKATIEMAAIASRTNRRFRPAFKRSTEPLPRNLFRFLSTPTPSTALHSGF